MANIILNGKTVVTQTGNDEPVLGSNVILGNDSLASATFPAGHIVQIDSSSFNGIQTLDATLRDITNLSCSFNITSGNKVFILVNIICGRGQDDYGQLYVTDGNNNNIYVNATGTGNQPNTSMAVTNRGNIAGDIYYTDQHSFSHLWTPSTTSVTVKVRGQCLYGANIYVNRPESVADTTWHNRTVSNITIMEIQS